MANQTKKTVQPSGPVWLGIDVGGTTVKLALFQAGRQTAESDGDQAAGTFTSDFGQLTEIGRTVIPTRTEEEGRRIMPDIALAVQTLADEASILISSIEGAGIGVPGPVLNHTDRGYPVAGCVNLNWTGIYYPGEELRDLTGIRHINVLNDANAAALGELYFSAPAAEVIKAASKTTAVMITIGTGIGGGIIDKGRIITGAFGAAGEVGHMPIVPADPLFQAILSADPDFGKHADLEYYTSANGIARVAAELLQFSNEASVLRKRKDVTAKNVFDAAKAGDPLAVRVIDFFFNTLGQGLATIASVVDPDLFIIGGGVAAAGDYLLDGLQTAYRRMVFHASRGTSFRLASLGNDAGLLGPLVPLLRKSKK
ncbi:MAG: ROK family protein [Firmicutes bacterium]|nr:ROK family protein [Bacillota bacterium]